MTSQPHPELASASATGLARRLAAGEMSARRLAEMYLERIEAIDRSGPRLRSVIEVNPDALQIASELDRQLEADGPRGPLHGLPVILKDNLDTGDRMLTTAGSLALTAAPAPADSAVAARLRAAGAVLLGKANLSEWANFRSSRSASGWSARGRQTRNPHVLDRTPCGSSSGSAVAVAAGLCALAVGTETDGSIVCPSSVCGVVGMKPTVGLVSQRGIIPISSSQDTAGPHARTVTDAALLLGGMAEDGRDYVAALAGATVVGRRIGVLGQPYTGYSEHADAVFARALDALREAGAELVEVELETTEELRSSQAERTILLHEFKAGLNDYLAARPDLPVRSLEDVIRFNEDHAAEEMPYFRQETFLEAQSKGGLDAPDYAQAVSRAGELSRTRGIDATMDRHGLDALAAPTRNPAWVVDRLSGDRGLGGASQMAAVAGYPSVTVPAGLVFDALPVGITFFGRAGDEAALLAIARGFEDVLPAWREPRYLASLELP